MNIHDLLVGLQNLPFSTAIREGDVLFPWIESLHVLAIVVVVGVIAVVDLRLIGVRAHVLSVRRLLDQLLPFTWIAFGIAVVTGAAMFASDAVAYAGKLPFQIKMALLLAAAANMSFFHRVTLRTIAGWDERRNTPPAAKVAGVFSLGLWTAIVVFGRWIGFI